MKFLNTTAKLAGAFGAALLLSTAIANAAPAGKHDMGPRAERHDVRGAQGKAMAKAKFNHSKDGRKFARGERHGMTHRCDKAHRHEWRERHAHKGRHHHHHMAKAGRHHERGWHRFERDRHDRHDHDRRG